MNAVEIEEAVSELASQPFDSQEFAFSFLEAFGNKSTTIKRLRNGNTNKSTINGGVLQRNNIHIAISDKGKVADTLTQLRESTETGKAKAQFILATDGQDFQAENIDRILSLAFQWRKGSLSIQSLACAIRIFFFKISNVLDG